ncbi:MAG: hypothetical protein ACOC8K_00875 [Gemmatimonadota bacterium]
MALRDVLFRCPFCGHEPTRGRKDHVHCPSCQRHFLRGPAPARIRIEGPEGERIVPARELVNEVTRRVEPVGVEDDPESDEEGSGSPEARVRARWAVGEETVRFRGELLGFTERLGEASEMRLRLTTKTLELQDVEAGGPVVERRRWDLLDLRALQASSSSLQIYTLSEELVHMRFLDDSAFRWETLLKETLRAAYRDAGRGEIVEFQPRITTR